MAAAHCFQTGNGPLFIAGQKQAALHQLSSQAPPDLVDHCRCDRDRTAYRSTLLPARPRPINKDRFTRIFLSDAVTTEFPSPGDDRIQFHAVSLLEASIFTKAVSKQRVLATDAFRLLCSPPSISLGNSPAKARQQAHTQHTKKRIASRVCSECRIKLSFWVDLEVVDGGRRGICLMERGFKKERMAVQLSFVNVQTTTYNIIIELVVLIN